MRVVAPGKVVLLGEYAVLDGAPAVVAAVDRGVACDVEPAPVLSIRTPGDDHFVRAALAAVDAPPATYTFTDWNPVRAASKVGLGGSAAATVAAVVAGRLQRGQTAAPAVVCAVADRVHRAVQGSGSGIDVAATAHGGVLRFEAGRVTPMDAVAPSLVFTGHSAQTGPRVAQYLSWTERDPFVAQSRALVARFAADPVRVLDEAGRLLRSMAEQAGVAYWTPQIDAIVTLAAAHGGAAKPSGAGGGDIVVSLFDDPADQQRFEGAAARAGFLPIAVSIAPGAQ